MLQVDLGKLYAINAVVVQGSHVHQRVCRGIKVRHSLTGVVWTLFEDDTGQERVSERRLVAKQPYYSNAITCACMYGYMYTSVDHRPKP